MMLNLKISRISDSLVHTSIRNEGIEHEISSMKTMSSFGHGHWFCPYMCPRAGPESKGVSSAGMMKHNMNV